MEAHIGDVSLGTNTQQDHILLLQERFTVFQKNHLRIKLENWEFMCEEMECLGFDVGYGWWKRAACKHCKICTYVMTPRRVYTNSEISLVLAVFTSTILTILRIHQPP